MALTSETAGIDADDTDEVTPLIRSEVTHGPRHKRGPPRKQDPRYNLGPGDTPSEGQHYRIRKLPVASYARRAVVLGSCVLLQMVTVGVGYSLPVMYVEVIRVFEVSRSQTALIQSIYMGIMIGGGLVFTQPLRRHGPGPCVVLGSLLGAAGLVVSCFAVNVEMLIVFTGLVAGVGNCFLYLASFVTVAWMFHENARLPLIVLTTGSSLGQFVFPYLAEIFITEFQWYGCFLMLGGLTLNCVVLGFVIYCSRKYLDIGADHKGNNSAGVNEVMDEDHRGDIEADNKGNIDTEADYRAESTRSGSRLMCGVCDLSLCKDAAIVTFLSSCFHLAFTGPIEAWFLVDIMVVLGYTREVGALLETVLGFSNFLGRMVGIFLHMLHRIPTFVHWVYLCPVVALSHALFINFSSYWPIFGSLVLNGIFFGSTTAQAPAIMHDVAGKARYPRAIAMMNLMYGIGNTLGGLIGGVIKDTTGRYDLMFYMGVASSMYIAIATAGMAMCLRKRLRGHGNSRHSNGYTPLPDAVESPSSYQVTYSNLPDRNSALNIKVQHGSTPVCSDGQHDIDPHNHSEADSVTSLKHANTDRKYLRLVNRRGSTL